MAGSALNRYLEAVSNNKTKSLNKQQQQQPSANDGSDRSTPIRCTADWKSKNNPLQKRQLGGRKQVLSLIDNGDDETDSLTTGDNDVSNNIYQQQQQPPPPQHYYYYRQKQQLPLHSNPMIARWQMEEEEEEVSTQRKSKSEERKQIQEIPVPSTQEKKQCFCEDNSHNRKPAKVSMNNNYHNTSNINKKHLQTTFEEEEDHKTDEEEEDGEDILQLQCAHCGHNMEVPSASITNSPSSSPYRSSFNYSFGNGISSNCRSPIKSSTLTIIQPLTTTTITNHTKKKIDISIPNLHPATSSPQSKIRAQGNRIFHTTTNNNNNNNTVFSSLKKLHSSTATTNISGSSPKNSFTTSNNNVPSSLTGSTAAATVIDDPLPSQSTKVQNNKNDNYSNNRYSNSTTTMRSWPLTMYSSGNNPTLDTVPTSENINNTMKTAITASMTITKEGNYLDTTGVSSSNEHFVSVKERKIQLWGTGPKESLRAWEQKKMKQHQQPNSSTTTATTTTTTSNRMFVATTISSSGSNTLHRLVDAAPAAVVSSSNNSNIIKSSYAAPSSIAATHNSNNNITTIPEETETKTTNSPNDKINRVPLKGQSFLLRHHQRKLLERIQQSSDNNDDDDDDDTGVRYCSPAKSVSISNTPTKVDTSSPKSEFNHYDHTKKLTTPMQKQHHGVLSANPLGSSNSRNNNGNAVVVTPERKENNESSNIISSGKTRLLQHHHGKENAITTTAAISPIVSFNKSMSNVPIVINPLTPPSEEKELKKSFLSTGKYSPGINSTNTENNKKGGYPLHQHHKIHDSLSSSYSRIPGKSSPTFNNNNKDFSVQKQRENLKKSQLNSVTNIISPSSAFKSRDFLSQQQQVEKMKKECQQEKSLKIPVAENSSAVDIPSVKERIKAFHSKVYSNNTGVIPEKSALATEQSNNILQSNGISSTQLQISLQTVNSGRQLCVSPLSSVDASYSSFWEDEMNEENEDLSSSEEETVSTLTNPTFTGSAASHQKSMCSLENNSNIANTEQINDLEKTDESPNEKLERNERKKINVREKTKIPISLERNKIQHAFHTAALPSSARPNYLHQDLSLENLRQLSTITKYPSGRRILTVSETQDNVLKENSETMNKSNKYLMNEDSRKALPTKESHPNKPYNHSSLNHHLRPQNYKHATASNGEKLFVKGSLGPEYLFKLGRTMELAADFKKRYRVWEMNKDTNSSEITSFMKRLEASSLQKHKVIHQKLGRSDHRNYSSSYINAAMQPPTMQSIQLTNATSSLLPPLHPSQKSPTTTDRHRKASESFYKMRERFNQKLNKSAIPYLPKRKGIAAGEI